MKLPEFQNDKMLIQNLADTKEFNNGLIKKITTCEGRAGVYIHSACGVVVVSQWGPLWH